VDRYAGCLDMLSSGPVPERIYSPMPSPHRGVCASSNDYASWSMSCGSLQYHRWILRSSSANNPAGVFNSHSCEL